MKNKIFRKINLLGIFTLIGIKFTSADADSFYYGGHMMGDGSLGYFGYLFMPLILIILILVIFLLIKEIQKNETSKNRN